jgi:hypothetical protein
MAELKSQTYTIIGLDNGISCPAEGSFNGISCPAEGSFNGMIVRSLSISVRPADNEMIPPTEGSSWQS